MSFLYASDLELVEQEMPIRNQAEWDQYAVRAVREGNHAGINRALSSEFRDYLACHDDEPSLVPFVRPACSWIVKLAAQKGAVYTYQSGIPNSYELAFTKLLRHPACCNPAVQKSGATIGAALVAAAGLGSPALMKAVLKEAASIPAIEEDREVLRAAVNRALQAACEAGKQDAVEYLVVDVQASYPQGGPMLVALREGDLDALKQLLAYPGIQPTPRMLLTAAKHGHFQLVDWILTHHNALFTKEAVGEAGLKQLMLDAVKHDYAQVVSWVLYVYPVIPWLGRPYSMVEGVLRDAVRLRRLAVQAALMPYLGWLGRSTFLELRKLAAETGNAEGLQLLLDSAPAEWLVNSHGIQPVRVDQTYKAAILEAMRDQDNGELEKLLTEGLPLTPDSREEILHVGIARYNFTALKLFLEYVTVDQAILDEHCRWTQQIGHQQMMDVFCLKQPRFVSCGKCKS